MKVTSIDKKLEDVKADALAVILFEGEKLEGEIARLDKKVDGAVSEALRLKEFKGKLYDTTSIFTHRKISSIRILLIGGGKKKDFSSRIARNLAGTAVRRAKKIGVKTLAFHLYRPDTTEEIIEGAKLGDFDPGIYKSKKTEGLKELVIVGLLDKEILKHSTVVADAINKVRKMQVEPANIMTPREMANEAERIGRKYGFKVEVIDEKEAEKRGMGAFIGVAKGSEEPSFMVSMSYTVNKKAPTLAVVGKGITFDSGGISLKPSGKMHDMKMDMSGAASCLGFMYVVGELKPKVNVVAVMPLTENLPGGKALKPGDILKSMSGKTIEVLNTDAEGRVVLADGLAYAGKFNPDFIVDLATLTGAVDVALGGEATAILGRSQKFIDKVISAGEKAGERLWQFPIYTEHKDLLRSDIADLSNIPPSRSAGVIAAAVFLQEFVKESVDWAHLDIASTAWVESEKPYLAKGPTGVGVRTLVKFVENLEKES